MSIREEFMQIYRCEKCGSRTRPTFDLIEAEEHNASIGAIMIRRHRITGEETRRSVMCYQCMRKTNEEDICTKDEKPFMAYTQTRLDEEDE
jgi:hypothetical protein